VDEFKKKGLQIVTVNRKSFQDASAEELDRWIDGASKAGLRQDPGCQVSPCDLAPAPCGAIKSTAEPSMTHHDRHRRPAPGDGGRRRVPCHRRGRGPVGTPIEAWAALASSGLLGLTVFYQFFTRYVLNDSAAWTEEIARYLLIATVFVGASIGVAKNNHIQVDFFYRYMPAGVSPGLMATAGGRAAHRLLRLDGGV
jgi:hypothetical protein